MTRKEAKDRHSPEIFPVEDYWEEARDTWEGDLGEDRLGADHAARFEIIAILLERGSLPAQAKAAIVTKPQIEELVVRLGLDEREQVVERLWAIAGRHLRPVHRKLLGSDLARTKQVLDAITLGISKLEALLEKLPPVTCQFLETSFERMPLRYRSNTSLDIDALERALRDLAHTTFFVAKRLERERKRPVNVLRRQTLKDVAETIEAATGRSIKTTWSKKGRANHTFRGAEGEVLRDFMRVVEPTATERSLVGLLRDVRAATRHRTTNK